MHTQLMSFASVRMQGISGNARSIQSIALNHRLRINNARLLISSQNATLLSNMRAPHKRKRPRRLQQRHRAIPHTATKILRRLTRRTPNTNRRKRRQTFIHLSSTPLLKQHLIGTTTSRIPHKHQNTRSKPIQPMRRNNIRFTIPLTKPHQSRLAIPHPPRHCSQKMRLIHHNNPLILIQHLAFKRNPRLLNHIPMPPPTHNRNQTLPTKNVPQHSHETSKQTASFPRNEQTSRNVSYETSRCPACPVHGRKAWPAEPSWNSPVDCSTGEVSSSAAKTAQQLPGAVPRIGHAGHLRTQNITNTKRLRRNEQASGIFCSRA
ncbi:hypothetical protein G1C95_1336 [Bifidobacterium sp. DSM 109957]|uniref:Uncharacterized protein n=1 Tax=Bifidobacterium oedipodis TaxID=2675322 RepID=A0A7Y0EPR5_9BIFI|nr:hypothetical protein [Bifidobacterium sp. DSM 109957]